MLERRSPLTQHVKPGNYHVAGNREPSLILSERPLGTLMQFAGWEDFEKRSQPLLKKFGLTNSGDYRTFQKSGNWECYKIAPDKILIRHKEENSIGSFASLTNAKDIVALDLSHARCVISITGSDCEALLARLSTIDFSQPAFQSGQFVQTGIHHVAVLIKRECPTEFEIFAPATFAASLWDFICTCATNLGYRVEGGVR